MSTRDLRYYGVSEEERIYRSINKKQRWVNSHLNIPNKLKGIELRTASIINLYRRLSELEESHITQP